MQQERHFVKKNCQKVFVDQILVAQKVEIDSKVNVSQVVPTHSTRGRQVLIVRNKTIKRQVLINELSVCRSLHSQIESVLKREKNVCRSNQSSNHPNHGCLRPELDRSKISKQVYVLPM